MFCLWLNASICGLYNANRFGRKHFGKIGTTFQRNKPISFHIQTSDIYQYTEKEGANEGN